MPGFNFCSTNTTTRYQKLDDTIFLLCRNCGHSVKSEEIKKMASAATISQPSGSNLRFRTNPKHFLTWSANAANHKIQKLSKNFAQNVSKLQNKMEKALTNQQNHSSSNHQSWDPSCIDNESTTTTPTQTTNKCGESNLSVSIEDKYSHLLANNNVNVAIVHNLNLHKNKSLVHCPNNLNHNSVNDSGNEWTSICRTRKRFDFEIEKTKLAQSLGKNDGGFNDSNENIVVDMLELGNVLPNNIADDEKCINDSKSSVVKDELQLVIGTYNLNTSSSSNNTSLSTISIGGVTTTTCPINSPHWSRSSSMSNSGDFNNDNTKCLDGGNKQNKVRNVKQSFISTLNQKRQNESCPNITKNPEGNKNNHNNNNSCNNQGKTDNSSTSSTISLLQQQRHHHSSSSLGESTSSSSGFNDNHHNTTKSMMELLGHPIATSTPSKLAVTTFEEESELRHAPWFQAGLPREIALEVLKNEPIGSFIVRESTTKSGCFALSIRVPREFQPSGIAHYLILKTGRGYKIKGFTKEFGSLTSLITHHSVMPELLPCPLSLHLYKPATTTLHLSRLEYSDFVEPEKLVTTFRKYTDF